VTRPPHPVHAIHNDFCAVAPSPELRQRLREQLGNLRAGADAPVTLAGDPKLPGFNDGTILPPSAFGPGTPLGRVQSAARTGPRCVATSA